MFFVDPHRHLTSWARRNGTERRMQKEKDVVDRLLVDARTAASFA